LHQQLAVYKRMMIRPPYAEPTASSGSGDQNLGRVGIVSRHRVPAWTAPQIVAASADDSAPACLLHDRDQVYGQHFRHRVKGMRIEVQAIELPTTGKVVQRPEVGGLRHRYLRQAA
jgi:hypothetical protein